MPVVLSTSENPSHTARTAAMHDKSNRRRYFRPCTICAPGASSRIPVGDCGGLGRLADASCVSPGGCLRARRVHRVEPRIEVVAARGSRDGRGGGRIRRPALVRWLLYLTASAAALRSLCEFDGSPAPGAGRGSLDLLPDALSYLIAAPNSEDGLRRAIGEAHRRYTRRVNFRERWRGDLWQGRFASFVMDEPCLLAAARYVELNPVHARLTIAASNYRWSCPRNSKAAAADPKLGKAC